MTDTYYTNVPYQYHSQPQNVELIPTYVPIHQMSNNFKQYDANENDVNVPLYVTTPEVIEHLPNYENQEVTSYSTPQNNYCGIFLLFFAICCFFLGLGISIFSLSNKINH